MLTMETPLAPTRLELRLCGGAHAVSQAREAVDALLAPHALPARTLYRIELVLEELHTNIARYAFAPGTEVQLGLVLEVRDDHVRIEFDDAGRAFDPTLATPAPLPDTLEQATVGGHGLRLVRNAARSMSYTRRDGRNLLRVEIARA
jgi:serine/threonine-protein kinase RsbW